MMDLHLRNAIKKLAGDIAGLQRRVRAIETASQGKFRSITGGGTRYYDDEGNVRVILGNLDDGSFTFKHENSPALEPPSDPEVDTQPGLIIVTWDGKSASGDDWPLDFSHVDVHFSTVSGEPPTDDTQVATFPVLTGGSATIAAAGTQYITLTSVNRSDARSDPSAELEATPPDPVTEGGIKTYYTDEEPVGLIDTDEGALWYDTNDGNLLWRWNGSDWQRVPVGGGAIDQGAITTGHFGSLDGLIITGNTVRTAASGERVELSADGLLVYDSNEVPRKVSTNGGDVSARLLTVDDDATFSDSLNIYGKATLNSGAGAPGTAPVLSPSWKGVTPSSLAGAERWTGLCADSGGSNWVTLHAGEIAPITAPYAVIIDKTTGAVTTQALTWSISGAPSPSTPYVGMGVTRIGTSYFILTHRPSGPGLGTFILHKFNTSWVEIQTVNATTSLGDLSVSQDPVIGTDGTNILVSYITYLSNGTAGAQVRKWNTSLAVQPSLLHEWLSRITITAIHGSSADLSGSRLFFTHSSGSNFRVADASSGARSINDEWQAASAGQKGIWWDNTRFWALDVSGRINRYSIVTSDRTESYTYAWSDGGSQTTLVSPHASITRIARSYVHIQVNAPPISPPGLVAAIYGGTSVRTKQFNMSVGQREIDYGDLVSGAAQPSVSTFTGAGVTAASVEATDGGFKIDGSSDGSVGTGTFRDSVDARTASFFRAGSYTTGTFSGSTDKTITITFAVPFPAGSAVRAWIEPTTNGTNNPISHSVSSASVTQIVVKVSRPGSTSAATFWWFAGITPTDGASTTEV